MRSAWSRRPAKLSTSNDSRSIHCASSTMHSKRLFGGDLGEQRDGGEPHDIALALIALARSERGFESGPLAVRKPLGQVEVRQQEPVQRGEPEGLLRVDPGDVSDGHVRGRPRDLIEQGGLPHPRFAVDDQHGAHALSRPGELGLEHLALGLPTYRLCHTRDGHVVLPASAQDMELCSSVCSGNAFVSRWRDYPFSSVRRGWRPST